MFWSSLWLAWKWQHLLHPGWDVQQELAEEHRTNPTNQPHLLGNTTEERRGRTQTQCHCTTSSRGEWPTAVTASAEPDSQRPSQCPPSVVTGLYRVCHLSDCADEGQSETPNPPVAIWVLISAHHLYSVRFWLLRPVCKGAKTHFVVLRRFSF